MIGASNLRWEALPPLWLIVLVILPLLVLSVRFCYRREAGRVGWRLRMVMGGLRILAISLVLVALWGPYTETVGSEPFKRHLILAIDTSESMSFRDGYESSRELSNRIVEAAKFPSGTNLAEKQRIEIVRRLIGADRKLLEKLADTFRLHIYTFDSAPAGLFEPRADELPGEAADRILAALPRLKATGSVTRIGTAIRDLVRAFDAKNEPVAGIIMFTDGRHTGGAPDPIEEAERAAHSTREPIPIFPVAMGNPATAVNIGVSRVDAPEVVLAGDEVSFTVHVHARGLEGIPAQVEAWVLDADGNPKEQRFIDTEPFNLPGDDDPARKVTFRDTFQNPGTYRLKIGVPPNKAKGEAVSSDNYKLHVLKVAKLKMRVLLIANRPSWTYRYLTVALFRARNTIEANALLLSAEPEWPQEASRDIEPIRVFPQTRQELAQYDVILMLDVDPTNLRIDPARDRERFATRLEEWVKQGGGLAMEAGRDENIPNAYRGTAVMSLLPVVPYAYLREDRYQAVVQRAVEKRHKLTDAGLHHPVMRILKDPEAVRPFWDQNDYYTQYYWYAPVKKTKSSATALTVRRDRSGEVYLSTTDNERHPLLAIQTYGLGKVLWVGTDELWRLRGGGLRDPNLYYWRFWSGVIRHLATYRLLGGNRRIKIWVDRTDRRYRVGDLIGVEAKFLDKEFKPVEPPGGKYDGFERKIKLRKPDGDEEEITLYGEKTSPPEGLFRTQLHAGEAGTYRLIAESDGDEEPADTLFIVESKTIEMADPLMNRHLLEAIAAKSQAGPPLVLSPDQFQSILDFDQIPRTGVVRSGETHRTDLWDRAWLLWVFTGLLAAEWILRRLNLLL